MDVMLFTLFFVALVSLMIGFLWSKAGPNRLHHERRPSRHLPWNQRGRRSNS